MKAAVLLFLLSTFAASSFAVAEYFIALDEEDRYNVTWTVDKANNRIEFTISARTTGWVGFGLNPDAVMMAGSDMVIATYDGTTFAISDRHATSEATPLVDTIQSYDLVSYEVVEGASPLTTFTIGRAFDTCDNFEDVPITLGTMRMLFAWSNTNVGSGGALAQHSVRGGKTVNLLAGPSPPVALPGNTQVLEVTFDNVNVPPTETNYWCKSIPMPEGDFHVVMNEFYIEPANIAVVHHMLVYVCNDPLPNITAAYYEGDCFSAAMPWPQCAQNEPIAAWAVGGGNFYWPETVGYPFGTANGYTSLYLEMHYDNPLGLSSVFDSSGIKLHYTTSKRPNDAGVARLGSSLLGLLLPPAVPNFNVTGKCSSECTSARIPVGGINVFASLLHIHTTGRAIETRHYRDGVQLPDLNSDQNYDFNYQEISTLDPLVQILPGDYLETECHMSTADRTMAVVGGLGTPEEMCMNYVFYYPKVDFSYCESLHDTYGLDFAQGAPTGAGLFMWLLNRGLSAEDAQTFLFTWLDSFPFTDLKFQALMDDYSLEWNDETIADYLELFNTETDFEQCFGFAGSSYSTGSSIGPIIPLYDVTTPLPQVPACELDLSSTSSSDEDIGSGASKLTGTTLAGLLLSFLAAAVL